MDAKTDKAKAGRSVKRFLRPTLFVLLFFALHPSSVLAESPDDIVVFVNKSLDITSVDLGELKKIYLKQKTSWSSKDKIICINAKEGTALREAFRKRVLNMNAKSESIFWQEQKIRLQVTEPPSFENTIKAVFKVEMIFKSKGAISYAFRKDFPKNVVKPVLVIPTR